MHLSMSRTTTQTFTLLSIGHRAVGKTVFLAGSYAELHSESQTDRLQQLWFDCQDFQVQENIENILNYIVNTGNYPPATMKVTNFNFSLKLKRHSLPHTKTLCHFHWRDLPGESCNLTNLDFQTMAFSSHGCCVFIDTYALVHDNAYPQVLENIIKQVMAIAYLFYPNSSKYAFALILTKCDLLEPGLLNRQQLDQRLQPLTSRLDAVKANYQTFYSSIPIVYTVSASILKPKGAADPLLWLLWELSQAHNPLLMNNLFELVAPVLPKGFGLRQAMAEQTLHAKKPAVKAYLKNLLSSHLQPSNYKYILLLAIFMVNLLGVMGTFLMKDTLINYEQDSQNKTKQLDALKGEQPTTNFLPTTTTASKP
jgi:hypothetical protein